MLLFAPTSYCCPDVVSCRQIKTSLQGSGELRAAYHAQPEARCGPTSHLHACKKKTVWRITRKQRKDSENESVGGGEMRPLENGEILDNRSNGRTCFESWLKQIVFAQAWTRALSVSMPLDIRPDKRSQDSHQDFFLMSSSKLRLATRNTQCEQIMIQTECVVPPQPSRPRPGTRHHRGILSGVITNRPPKWA